MIETEFPRPGPESHCNEVPSVPKGPIHRRVRLKPSDASAEAMRADVRVLRRERFVSAGKSSAGPFMKDGQPLQIGADLALTHFRQKWFAWLAKCGGLYRPGGGRAAATDMR